MTMATYGLQDTLARQRKKYDTLMRLEHQAVAAGYVLFDPDFFEPYDRYHAIHGRLPHRDVVKVISPTGDLLVLRPDVTTSLSRQVIPAWQAGEELKVFYRTSVFHQKVGRGIVVTRQFGLEWFGGAEQEADHEMLHLAQALLADLNGEALLEIGDTAFLDAWLKEAALDETTHVLLLEALEDKNRRACLNILKAAAVETSMQDVLMRLFDGQGAFTELETTLDPDLLPPSMQPAWQRLKALETVLAKGDAMTRRVYDLAMVSPQNYYDGLIFKAYLEGVAVPVLRGGRYHPLTRRFGREIPAIGLSIDLDTWLEAVMRDA
ncbi:MAG: hypothetical protein EA374_05470 [Acholeplasmatales bacterium]|nr:MAG: hypothetical protein EA374_05470 [Acholeplasmatales bacterium]